MRPARAAGFFIRGMGYGMFALGGLLFWATVVGLYIWLAGVAAIVVGTILVGGTPYQAYRDDR